MNGLRRLTYAAVGTVVRRLAVAPLLGLAEVCERRSLPPGGARARPQDRRSGETVDFTFSRDPNDVMLGLGVRYTATFGRCVDGRINEVFLDCHKLASPSTDDALSIAHLISLALQHGLPVATLVRTAARFEDGRPCTLIGRVSDLLAEHEGAPAPADLSNVLSLEPAR